MDINQKIVFDINLIKKYLHLNAVFTVTLGKHKFTLQTYESSDCIRLEYRVDGKLMQYFIDIKKAQSNLGKGFYYYFVCPVTLSNCRNLYLHHTYKKFAAYKAFKGYDRLYYDNQTDSKTYRGLSKYFKATNRLCELEDNLSTLYYKGEPTKKYKAWNKLSNRLDNLGSRTILFLNSMSSDL